MQDTVEAQEDLQQTVHFSTDAAGIVDLARTMVLEGKWRQALKVLQSTSTPPLTLDLAQAILAGRMTLENEGEKLRVCAQDPQDARCQRYLSTLEWQTAGLLSREGEFFQPYGTIAGFTSEDEAYAVSWLTQRESLVSLDEYRKLRARYHLLHGDSDHVAFDIAKNPVVFKRAKDPALWVHTFEEEGLAWVNFCQHRKSSLRLLGESSSSSTKPSEASPKSWEFYMRGILQGLVYLSSRDEGILPEQELEPLRKALALREAFEEQVEMLDAQDPTFDSDGVETTEDRLFAQLERDLYTLMYTARVHRRAQQCGGYLELPVQDAGETCSVRVALVPFLHWARQRGLRKDEEMLKGIPTWAPVFPSGAKMVGDDPMHTDWWASAGLRLQEAYGTDHPVNRAAWKFAYCQAKNTGSGFVKLAGSGVVTGKVVFPQPGQGVPAGSIAVVPNAGVDYELALLSACKDGCSGAVIAEVGGKLAHLAIVSRETNSRLVVVDEALTKFQEGQLLRLDLDKNTLEIIEAQDL